jgi:hypothetical protein
MALDAPGLESDLLELFGEPPATITAGEVDVPASRADCAQAWADAMGDYASGIVPASTTVPAAASALALDLESAFASPTAPADADLAFTTFATAVGLGMVGFVSTPPPAPVGFALAFAEPPASWPETHSSAADSWASKVDAWMRTGTATPVSGGAPVPWS